MITTYICKSSVLDIARQLIKKVHVIILNKNFVTCERQPLNAKTILFESWIVSHYVLFHKNIKIHLKIYRFKQFFKYQSVKIALQTTKTVVIFMT